MDKTEAIFGQIAVFDSFANAPLKATGLGPGAGNKQLSKKDHHQVAHASLFGFLASGLSPIAHLAVQGCGNGQQ